MKFHIRADNELIAERADLQPAFVKGVMAAHLDKPEENPYQRQSFRNAWELGYQGVKQGKVVVENEKKMIKVVCAWCGKDMGEMEGDGVEGTSHGMCDECYEKAINE